MFHRGEHPILILDQQGKLLRSFGDGLFTLAHGLRIDAQDNIWVTDAANHTVIKFSPDGVPLLKLGEKDVPGEDATHFNKPADIAFATNGDFFIADGYGNSRVVKFNKDGKFLKAWGKKGTARASSTCRTPSGSTPRAGSMSADRENNRIQVFDADGKYLRQMEGFAPYGLFITPDQMLFVADGVANKVLKMTLDGKIITTWAPLALSRAISSSPTCSPLPRTAPSMSPKSPASGCKNSSPFNDGLSSIGPY